MKNLFSRRNLRHPSMFMMSLYKYKGIAWYLVSMYRPFVARRSLKNTISWQCIADERY